ncbi:MAG: hypothetical protein OEW39_09010 [Deltaproteobacteria bacterium]|nr:hypothetical protein [Deltaproteobacteria bacterium]
MKKLILLLAILLISTSATFAANTEMNRDARFVYLGMAAGLDIPSLATTPISVGGYLGQHFLVAGEFGIPKTIDFNDSGTGTKANVKYTNMGGYARWFPGNSFNVLLGIHQRNLTLGGTVQYTDAATGMSASTYVEAKMNAMVATLGLGNQWIADFGLTFGVDWFALRSVLSHTESITDSGGFTSLVPSEKDQVLKDMADINMLLNSFPGLLIVSVGWAF